jgi:hydrogenase expression/formation protein HypE
MAERIILAQGNGGRLMRELIEAVFLDAFGEAAPDATLDAAVVPAVDGAHIVLTTDGFTVQPLEFPGGNLGSLAVHGSVNDLAVSGAEPRYLTLGAVLEEGLEIAVLRRLVAGFAAAAREAGARLVAGDTKVVPRGSGGGAYFSVAGIGALARPGLGLDKIRPGDRLLVSGPVGDHGIAVMLAREAFDLKGDVVSDCGSVLGLCRALWDLPGLRFTRDPTRGGLATVAHEIAQASGHAVRLLETAIPVRPPTRSVCEMLGYDPLYLACEGRVVAVLDPAAAETALARWQALPEGRAAAIIGGIEPGAPRVVFETELGGERLLQELEDDPLPRIC